MSQIYEERLHQDLEKLKSHVSDVVMMVERALRRSLKALVEFDKQSANETIIGDLPINRAIRRIDRHCHFFVSRHLPSAGPLRVVSSILRMNIAIERIGDYAVTIARETKTLTKPLNEEIKSMIQSMAHEAFEMFHQAIYSFETQDADLARVTMKLAYQIDETLGACVERLVELDAQTNGVITDRFGILIILHRLERVSDQAKNICEETVFSVTGETKKPKQYHVLFVEESGACLTQMAVAYAVKKYPQLGTFANAGLHPAGEIDEACSLFLEEKGIYLDYATTNRIEHLSGDWEANHIIVSLQGPIEQYIRNIPFHTVSLEWALPPIPKLPADWPDVAAGFGLIFDALTEKIDNLVQTLYGEEMM